MSMYYLPLITLPALIEAPGEYLTRDGELVVIEKVSSKLGDTCAGYYKASGIPERWHKTGRILASSETPNDIVKAL